MYSEWFSRENLITIVLIKFIYHNIISISISIDVQYHCVNLFIQWNARAQELNLLCTYWPTDTYL